MFENLFPTMTTVTFRPESRICPQCGTSMKVLNTKTTTVATLAIGTFRARRFHYSCSSCRMVVEPEAFRRLVPERCAIGYDVLTYVGEAFFLRSRSNEQIVDELREKNVSVCRSEISYLAKKFIVYLALVHKEVRRKTRAFLSMNGGYILHLDGTCEGDSPHLISVLDGITEIVLDNTKIPTENAEDLMSFLKNIKAAYGDPVAVVSDMGKGILAAIKAVFKGVPLFICHYHFLKAVGKELLGEEYDNIRKRLKKHGIQSALRKRIRKLENAIGIIPPQLVETFAQNSLTIDALITDGLPHIAIHTLLEWALAAKHQGEGRGFPFDQCDLVFYQRLVTVYRLIGRYSQSGLFKTAAEKKLYNTIREDLQPVIRDVVLKRASEKLQEKVGIFSSLRAAMRIALPTNNRGLNDDGELCNMKTIEKEVTKFVRRLSRDKHRMKDNTYRKLIDHIMEYWDMLFCDPIVVETKAGNIIIQPQRTNNVLERFFRALMRAYRKRNGFQAVARVLKAMLKDTPLVINLRNKDFMNILLAGKKSLAERFADVDAEIVRQSLNELNSGGRRLSAKMKKIITSPTFPESLTALIDKLAS